MTPTPGWRFIEVPIALTPAQARQDRMRELHHLIAGALALWSSRIYDFDGSRFPNSLLMWTYCVDRLSGRRTVARPTPDQIQGCLIEVAEQIDPIAYRALNEMSIVMRSMEGSSTSGGLSVFDQLQEEALSEEPEDGGDPSSERLRVRLEVEFPVRPPANSFGASGPAPLADAPAGSLLSTGRGTPIESAMSGLRDSIRRRREDRQTRALQKDARGS